MQPTLNQPAKSNAFTGMFMNPLIRKLSKIDETSEDSATYRGIATKCGIFLLGIFIGVALAMILQSINPIMVSVDGDTINVSPAATIAAIVSGVFFLLTPILAFLIKATIPVTGTLYCASTGYLFTFLSLVIPEYGGAVLLAMILTVVIVAVMAFVYAKGLIKVNQKFRSVMTILFWSTVGSSVLVGVCYFIPALKGVTDFLQANPLLGILGSIAYVVIASLFLLVDFDTIEQAVERKLPRKYEWYAAFGLAFSVIWLFLKLLDLITKLKDNSSSNS